VRSISDGISSSLATRDCSEVKMVAGVDEEDAETTAWLILAEEVMMLDGVFDKTKLL
jgi:hypothetical protein